MKKKMNSKARRGRARNATRRATKTAVPAPTAATPPQGDVDQQGLPVTEA